MLTLAARRTTLCQNVTGINRLLFAANATAIHDLPGVLLHTSSARLDHHEAGQHENQPLTHSYCHVNTGIPLIGETIGQRFIKTSEMYPDRDALVFVEDKRRVSFTQLREQVEKFAVGLHTLGFRKGDRIGIWGPNHMEWMLTQLSAAYLGLILVNVNPAYHAQELKYALNKVSCKGIVLCPAFKTQQYYKTLQEIVPEIVSSKPGQIKSDSVPSLSHVIMTEGGSLPGTFTCEEVMSLSGASDHQEVQALQSTLQFDDPISLQFTSGTTGFPKGTLLSHHNILNNSRIIGKNLGYDEYVSRICLPVPLYHCFGMVLGSINIVNYGVTGVFPSRGFDAKSAMEAIQNEKCTAIYGTPTMFIDMLHHPEFDQYNFDSLRTGIMAGSPCPIEVMKQVIDRMNCKEMTIAYGLTETSPATHQTKRDADVSLRVSTIGEPIDHLEVKIINEEGSIVPVNAPGEICFRGHSVMLGYWEDEAKTKEVIDQAGWFHSGDLGTMDENRYCKIIGRLKDMVIRGGVNIFPREIEEFLYQHPKIEDIQVVGVSDDRLGEELCAWIRLKSNCESTPEEIKEFCKGKISHYKIPKYIKFVDSYPLTVSGKVKKFLIREQMEKELSSQST